MADYGNIFSPDYWTPEGYQWRAGSRKSSAHELAVKQDESKQDQFGAVGDFLGGIGKGVGDWWNNTVTKPASPETRSDVLNNIAPHPFSPNLERSSSRAPLNLQRPQEQESGEDILAALGGKFNSQPANTPFNNSVEADPNIDPAADSGIDPTEILKRLGQRFSFDEGSVDTSPLDSVLQNNLGAVNGARTAANDNFAKSDSNIKGMFGAHERDVRGQQGEIASRGAANEQAVGGIFDKTIAANKAQDSQRRQQDEEMYRRLGIAPAAAGPDLVGQAIAEGNNASQQSRDTRVAEAKTNTQTDISRNNTLASAVGNDGLQRRSDLNMRLQDILGDLGNKETEFNNQYQQNKLDLMQQAEDKSYDRWLQDRQFDMGMFNSINSSNAQATADEADRQNRIDVANINAGSRGSSQSSGASQGWLESASPEFQRAFVEIAQRVNIDQDPQKAIQMLADPKYGLNLGEVVTKVKDYSNLGKVNPQLLSG